MIRTKHEQMVEGDSKGKGHDPLNLDSDGHGRASNRKGSTFSNSSSHLHLFRKSGTTDHIAAVVLVRGTKSSHLYQGHRDEAEVGTRMASRRYLGATLIWALRTIRRTLYSMRVEIRSQWRCPLM